MSMSKQVPRAPGVSLLDPDATTLTLPPPWRRHTHARTHARAPIRQPELTHLFHVLSDSDPRALDGSDSDAGVAAAPIDRSGARSPVSNRMPCHLVNRSHLLVERSSSQADLVSRGRRRGILSRAVAPRSAGRGGMACWGVAEQGPRAPREKNNAGGRAASLVLLRVRHRLRRIRLLCAAPRARPAACSCSCRCVRASPAQMPAGHGGTRSRGFSMPICHANCHAMPDPPSL